eukprot:9512516-Prorocentrum_lima.AAC.1
MATLQLKLLWSNMLAKKQSAALVAVDLASALDTVVREILFGIPQGEGWDTCTQRLQDMGLSDGALCKVRILADKGG